jgi:serine/threonine-protein kinase
MSRVLFRIGYTVLLLAIFAGVAWLAFQKSIVGRSLTVPDLSGKPLPEAARIAHDAGLAVEEESTRARSDDKIPAGSVLLQQPEAGSLAKPAQVVRVVLSLGPRQIRVPDLTGLSPRAAALRLSQDALELGAVSTVRDAGARVGILAQNPEPEAAAGKSSTVEVLTNRGLAETRYVMPDLVGRDAERVKARLEAAGFRVGSARYESYEGVPADTILKQFPPVGYPLTTREVVSLTVARAGDIGLPTPPAR